MKRQRPSLKRVKDLEDGLHKATVSAENCANQAAYWRRMTMRAARLLTAPQGGQGDFNLFMNELLQELLHDMPEVYRQTLGQWVGFKWIDTNFKDKK